MSLVVIDGDLISFMSSAACEDRFITARHKQSGRSKQFGTRTLFKQWLSENSKWNIDDFEIVDERNVEDVAKCLHTIKMMVSNIVTKSGCKDLKVVMEGEGNFRNDILLPSRYKSNRKDMIKPALLGEAKDYLRRKYKAEFSDGWEADDVLSSYAYEGYKTKKRIVQATIDKDALQCPGWLFNWNKMESPEFIQGLGDIHLDQKGKVKGRGRKWLYTQWVLGDNTDFYKPTELSGIKFGDKRAFDALSTCSNDVECLITVRDLYKSWYPKDFEYIAWDGSVIKSNYKHQMQMYLDCARMRRWKDDTVLVEDMYYKMGIKL